MTELTTMVLIINEGTEKVLVQHRIKDWAGLSFPGGHVLDGESFVDCAAREVYEETGLRVTNLKGCGVIHWTNTKTHDRYLAFLYRTTDYTGELIVTGPEGNNGWMSVADIQAAPLDNGTHEILHMFLHDEYSEAFGSWSDDEPWAITSFK